MRTLLTLICALLACSRADGPNSHAQAITAAPSHLLVTLELSPTGLRLLNATEVKAPLPRLRVPEPNRWHAVFRDSSGALLHEIDLAPADELRAEFHGADEIDGHLSRKEIATFSLRLPNAHGTLTLRTDTSALGAVAIP